MHFKRKFPDASGDVSSSVTLRHSTVVRVVVALEICGHFIIVDDTFPIIPNTQLYPSPVSILLSWVSSAREGLLSRSLDLIPFCPDRPRPCLLSRLKSPEVAARLLLHRLRLWGSRRSRSHPWSFELFQESNHRLGGRCVAPPWIACARRHSGQRIIPP